MMETDCAMEDHSTNIDDGNDGNDGNGSNRFEFPMECPSPNIAVDLSSPDVTQPMICDLESNDGDTSNINNGSFVDVDTPLRQQQHEQPMAPMAAKEPSVDIEEPEQSLEDQLAQLRGGHNGSPINMSNISNAEVHNGSMVQMNGCNENEEMQMDDDEEMMSPLSKIVSNDVDAANQS